MKITTLKEITGKDFPRGAEPAPQSIGIEAGEIHRGFLLGLGAETVIGTMGGVMPQRLLQGRQSDMPEMHDHQLHIFRRAFAP